MGRISAQHVRVFAMFSAALYLIGLSFAYGTLGDPTVAILAALSAIGFTASIFNEARS